MPMPSKLLFALLSRHRRCFIPQIQGAEPEVIDGVAAVVNGDVITFSQVQEVSGPRERTLREQYTGQELIEKIKEARLGRLKRSDRSPVDRPGIQKETVQHAGIRGG